MLAKASRGRHNLTRKDKRTYTTQHDKRQNKSPTAFAVGLAILSGIRPGTLQGLPGCPTSTDLCGRSHTGDIHGQQTASGHIQHPCSPRPYWHGRIRVLLPRQTTGFSDKRGQSSSWSSSSWCPLFSRCSPGCRVGVGVHLSADLPGLARWFRLVFWFSGRSAVPGTLPCPGCRGRTSGVSAVPWCPCSPPGTQSECR